MKMMRESALPINDPSVLILQCLRKAGNTPVSGEQLATTTGMSRVAVWKRLQKLKEEGFQISSGKRSGYRLSKEPSAISPFAITAHLPPSTPLISLYFTESSRSTNSDAQEKLAQDSPAPFACLTRKQTNGRGRLGRSWYSNETGGLCLTLGFRPLCPPAKIQLLSLWCGIRLCRCLRNTLNLPVMIKWPNDLWIEGKKIAGILAEATYEADRVNGLVFGIGLNVNTSEKDFPPELAEVATSLRIASQGKSLPINKIAAGLISEILAAYEDCMNGIDEDVLSDLWSEYACFLNEPIRIITSTGETHQGTFTGIDRAGSLILRSHSGTLQTFRSGDVSLRPPSESST